MFLATAALGQWGEASSLAEHCQLPGELRWWQHREGGARVGGEASCIL